MKESTINDILLLVINDYSIMGSKGWYEAIEILLDENTTLEDNFEWLSYDWKTKKEAKIGIAKAIIYELSSNDEVWEEEEEE